jgi:hypothetical protein
VRADQFKYEDGFVAEGLLIAERPSTGAVRRGRVTDPEQPRRGLIFGLDRQIRSRSRTA